MQLDDLETYWYWESPGMASRPCTVLWCRLEHIGQADKQIPEEQTRAYKRYPKSRQEHTKDTRRADKSIQNSDLPVETMQVQKTTRRSVLQRRPLTIPGNHTCIGGVHCATGHGPGKRQRSARYPKIKPRRQAWRLQNTGKIKRLCCAGRGCTT
ncbi:hypothetical protein BC628DRAFT_138187 [Trametes gibbosa]|nr:hypothetical protein BC628DRAFT_138187 [Trametes gibbosa]